MQLTIPVAVGIGGFVGAILRFYISGAVIRTVGEDLAFSGTTTVNLTGCFFIGVLATFIVKTSIVSPTVQQLLISGLLGSLTTFSTFALDTLNLLHSGRVGAALANVLVNVIAGVLLAWCGTLVAESVLTDREENFDVRTSRSETHSNSES